MIILVILSLYFLPTQDGYVATIMSWQQELNAEFADPEETPLPGKQRKRFKGLDFFEINETYKVKVWVERTPGSKPFTMPTTTDRLPVYERFGIAHFSLLGQSFKLPIYQNQSLRETEEYKDYLFLPFTDLSNDFETYGGGRYLDLKIPKGDSIEIDFNKAYNPYCAYNAKYSCPIPPRENFMDIKVLAGVKSWKPR